MEGAPLSQPEKLSAAFYSLADLYDADDRVRSLRLAAEALALRPVTDAPAWQSAAVTLPAHAKRAAQQGVGALYAALRGIRAAKLGVALRRWAVTAARLPDPLTTSNGQSKERVPITISKPIVPLQEADGVGTDGQAQWGGEMAADSTSSALRDMRIQDAVEASSTPAYVEGLAAGAVAVAPMHDSPRTAQRPFLPFGPAAPFTPNTG